MFSVDDCLSILVDNGYTVRLSMREARSQTDQKDETRYKVYETSCVHRSANTRYSCDDMTLSASFNKLLEFVKDKAPLDFGDHKKLK